MSTPIPLRHRLLPHLLVLFLYGLVSLIVTWPLALQFGSATLGPYYADRMQNEWNLWWTGTALLDRHISPFATDMLFYPQGVDLYFHTLNLPLVLLALPIARLFGLTVGYNSSVILALVLAAYAGFRLARFVSRRAAPAFIGGLIVGFNPLSQVLLQGQVNALDLAPCVLCIEFYLRSWRTGRRRDMILTGLFFALAVLTVGYYEGYLLLFFALHLLWLGWSILRARRGSRSMIADSVAPPQAQQAAPLQPLSDSSPITVQSAAPPATRNPQPATRNPFHVSRFTQLLLWAAGPALLIAGPYVLAAAVSLGKGQIVPYSQADLGQTVYSSADLLSFLLPNREGWLLGRAAPWWQGVNPAIYDFTWLGPVTLILAALGLWAGHRVRSAECGVRNDDVRTESSPTQNSELRIQNSSNSALRTPHSALDGPTAGFWLAFAMLGALLALGPVLQVNGQPVGEGSVPLPFALLRQVPLFNIMRVPFRFSTLTWIGLGVLAAQGTAWLLMRYQVTGNRQQVTGDSHQNTRNPQPATRPTPRLRNTQYAILAGLIVLLLLEMPLHSHATRAATLPASMQALAADPAPGALVELPFTQHGGLDAARMLYQTGHGRAITGGYLSRDIIPPDRQACSPFGVLSRYPRVDFTDIVSPTAATQVPALLTSSGVGFLAVYKWASSDAGNGQRLPADQVAGLQTLAGRLGTPIADDDTATIYRVNPAPPATVRFFQLGSDWFNPESGPDDSLFRWMNGAQADLCVFSPAAERGTLTLAATSFAKPRRLQVFVGDQVAVDITVPNDGQLHSVTVPARNWPAGPQRVRLIAPEGSDTPLALGLGRDARPLSLGFGPIRWEPAP